MEGKKLCVRAEKGRYLSYHCCYYQVSTVVSNMCSKWSIEQLHLVAFIINKVHIFFFANISLIYITYTEDRGIILWQRVLSLLTVITKCKRS